MGGYKCEPRPVALDLSQFETVRIKTPSGSVSLRLWHAERVFGGYLPSPSDSIKDFSPNGMKGGCGVRLPGIN